MTFKDKLLLYIQNKSNVVDNEYDEHLQYTRYHSLDEVDYLESIIRKTRRDAFREFTKDIFCLMSLSDKNQFNELQHAIKTAKKR